MELLMASDAARIRLPGSRLHLAIYFRLVKCGLKGGWVASHVLAVSTTTWQFARDSGLSPLPVITGFSLIRLKSDRRSRALSFTLVAPMPDHTQDVSMLGISAIHVKAKKQ